MEKYPFLATAKIGIVNENIDKQMCQIYHTPIFKKFSNESHHDELILPAALNHLKDQKSHVLDIMADTSGMSVIQIQINSLKNGNLVVEKEPEPVSKYKFLQLATSSISLLAEDMKNVHVHVGDEDQDQSPSSGHSDKKNIGRKPESWITGNRYASGRLTISDDPPLVPPFFVQIAEFVCHRRGLAQKQSGNPSSATPMNPWIIFGDQQRAGQYTILECFTAIKPVITAMLFAGHWASPIQMLQLNQNDLQDVHDLGMKTIMIRMKWMRNKSGKSARIFTFSTSVTKWLGSIASFAKTRGLRNHPRNFSSFVKNEFVGFIVDSYTSQLIMAIRHKFQSILVKGICDPGRNTVTAEEAVLRTVLSILSSEEMSMHLVQPSNIGRLYARCSQAQSWRDVPGQALLDVYSTSQRLCLRFK